MDSIRELPNLALRRPISLLSSGLFIALILYELVQIARGELYMETLGYIDGTTVIELAVMGLWGLYALRGRSDLQAAAFTLVNALSFIFSYEALYKWSFFLIPFGKEMPPEEFRQMVIQIGIALSVLTGVSTGVLAPRRLTWLWVGLFALLWVFWLAVGYPQIDGGSYWPQALPIPFTYNMTYALNRATKFVLWLAYMSLFPPLRSRASAGVSRP
jgi:hypothetical protein